jgi:signal transduction histidine kinase/CheY-like chemotaxis protein
VVYEDEQKTLWIGSPAGLVRLRDGIFTTFGFEAGIDSAVEQITGDLRGNLWLGTESGILRVARAELDAYPVAGNSKIHLARYGLDDGLPSPSCSVSTHPLAMRSRDGRLWFATTRGLAVLDSGFWKPDPAPAVVLIEGLIADRDSLIAGGVAAPEIAKQATEGMIGIAPGRRNHLEFKYSAVNLAGAGRVRYRYRLEGWDAEWIDAAASETAIYSRLKPGEYRFRVAAANSDGMWNEQGAALSFRLEPYFYEMPVFYLSAALALAVALASAYRHRVRGIRKHEQRLARLVAERTVELQAAEAQARHASFEAQAANGIKSEFLANMSHEIRTPMGGILGMIQLALDSPLPPEVREYLVMGRQSADTLLALLNDVLDLSKIEAGMLRIENILFDVREVIADAATTMSMHADEKGLRLFCSVSRETPLLLVGDPSRIRQVVINLASNAVKFTSAGQVSIRAHVEAHSADAVQLHVAVSDTGPGVASGQERAIFEAFRQADSSVSRKFGGTGLGLAISRQLVELMGGAIWCESQPNRGSTFRFTANVRCPAAEQRSDRGLPAQVVLISASEELRTDVEELFASEGVAVLVHASLAAAMDSIKKCSSAPVLVDGASAERDDALAFLRGSGRRSITLAGPTTFRSIATSQENRAARLLLPLRRSDVLEALGVGRQSDHAASPGDAARMPVNPLRVLVAEDNLVNQIIAVRLLEKAGHTVTIANNGAEAVSAVVDPGVCRFDLIFMDIQMPVMDGYEATRRIREHERRSGSHTPIVAVTAHAMKGDQQLCLNAGMDDYLAKPYRATSLGEVIERMTPVGRVL